MRALIVAGVGRRSLWYAHLRQLKLIDYSLSEMAVNGVAVKASYSTYATRNYRAPEIYKAKLDPCRLTSYVDVWAAGCVAFEARSGCMLVNGRSSSTVQQNLSSLLERQPGAGKKTLLIDRCCMAGVLQYFCRNCLRPEPGLRCMDNEQLRAGA